jgi:hypothetical protein
MSHLRHEKVDSTRRIFGADVYRLGQVAAAAFIEEIRDLDRQPVA